MTTFRGHQARLRLSPHAADRSSAENAAAPMNQSREAHHSARPHHSPGQPAVTEAPDQPQRLFRPTPLGAGPGSALPRDLPGRYQVTVTVCLALAEAAWSRSALL
jgi:hypothetical protein